MSKIKKFFSKLKPSKRKIIQLYSALLYNAYMKGFITGEIFQGKSKSVCLPGLNCYSCPGAIGACPLGSIQNALAESKTKLPTYVFGIILLYCIIFGRTICGFLCPVGLLQELLYKIKTPKVRKSKITRCLSYFKYVLLFVLVIGLPLIYSFQAKGIPLPGFCKYICPAGTFEGAVFLLMNKANQSFFEMLGALFTWKFILLIIFIVASVFIYRFFCRFFCPLGAIYGIFNKLSILGVKVDKTTCTHCNKCITNCKMDVKDVGDHECIQCGECMKECPVKCINWKLISKAIKEDDETESIQNATIDEVNTKKVFKISRKNFNIITYVLMLVSLTTVMILVNIGPNTYKNFDIVDDFKITDCYNQTFDISVDTNATLLYFFNDVNDLDIQKLNSYRDDKLNIILLASTDISIDSIVPNDSNFKFVVDVDNKLLKKFNNGKANSYSVFLDFNDKILISKVGMITDSEYFEIINYTLLGLTVGNEVGNICINQEINLIGSDDTFSVASNKGKITIINFWYTDCTPCVQELPHFNKLYEEYSEYVNIIAVHEATGYQNDPEDVENFIKTQFEGFSIMFGYDNPQSSYYTLLGGKKAWPVTVIVDQDGVISNVTHGSMTEDDLRIEIEKLID
ncbi:MAG: 4Fe-4S binding protein [Bacilli bacterium]|nr:4Fe-4S binding protein [Bacilli bacterium]